MILRELVDTLSLRDFKKRFGGASILKDSCIASCTRGLANCFSLNYLKSRERKVHEWTRRVLDLEPGS